MNFNETEQVQAWTTKKRGRLSALANALGLDRRVLHDRLNNYKLTSIDKSEVDFHQGIIELKETDAISLLAELKKWLSSRINRKSNLANALNTSCATVSKWMNTESDDTCLLDRISEIRAAMPAVERAEKDDYETNRKIANRWMRDSNKNKSYSIKEMADLCRRVLGFSNASVSQATLYYTRGKIQALGWSINSLSKGYKTSMSNCNQAKDTVSSIEMCNQIIDKKHKKIDTAICIGKFNLDDVADLVAANVNVVFHEKESENVMGFLKKHNITTCGLNN